MNIEIFYSGPLGVGHGGKEQRCQHVLDGYLMKQHFVLKIIFAVIILLALTFSIPESTPVSAAPNATLDWSISGTVYGGSNPLPDVVITLNDAGTGNAVGTATSNGSGFYSIAVNNGTYNMTIAPPSGSGFSNSAVNGIVVSGGNLTQNVVLVAQAVTISGVVRYPDGTLAPNIWVYAEGIGDQPGGGTTTDANGAYTIPVNSGMSFRLIVYGGAYLGPQAKPSPRNYSYKTTSYFLVAGNVTQDITLLPFMTISGTTTDANGVAVGNVRLYRNSISFYDSNDRYIQMSDENVYSDTSTGTYSMIVIAGNYSFTAYPPAGRTDILQTSYTGVNIAADTVRDFALIAPPIISGQVRYPDGTLAPNISVVVHDHGDGETGGSAKTDVNGAYAIPISAGSFYVSVNGGYAYDSQAKPSPYWYSYYPIPSLVIVGNVTRDITLPPYVTISGTTTDANGVAVGNVRLYRESASFYLNGNYVSIDSETVYSDATGAYSMVVIPYSNYSFTITPPSGNTTLLVTSYTSVSITTDTTMDFSLIFPKVLSGVVRYPDGMVAPNTSIVALGLNGATGGEAKTDTNGAYVIPVSLGTFNISVIGGDWNGPQAKPSPRYYIYDAISNLVVTGNVTQDITLPPYVTISGKTTDANGVAVRNVRLYRGTENFYLNGNSVSINIDNVYSDETGAYSMVVIPYSSYSFTATPPTGSGFSPIIVYSNVSTNILQNWIMAFSDTTAPTIISGPTVTNITDSSALVQWQTSEPAQGGVKYGTTNPPDLIQSETSYVVTHSQVLTGLSADTLYYASIFASDKAGNGPLSSSVVSFRTMALADITPPFIIEGPTISAITHTSATVTWQTNEPATGVLSYGITTAFGQTVAANTLATSHSITLSGLTPETIYSLKISTTDAASNVPTDSAVVNFWTLAAPNISPPVIVEGPMAINISDTGVTIIWRTDEPATSGVSLNDGTAYQVYSDDTLTAFHSVEITGLSPSTTYTYVASSKDAFGNGPTLSSPRTFTTLSTPDTNSPVLIEGPYPPVDITHESAVIRWKTDEPADALIEYGVTPAFGSSEVRTALVTDHSIPLTGLLPVTLYYYRVSSKDAAGNSPMVSATYTFTTDDLPNNKTPVITSAPQIIYSSNAISTVSFETNIPCDTVVEYGEAGILTNRQSESEKVTKHQIAITNLIPNTSYSMTVSCTDMAGNTVVAQADKLTSNLAFNLTNVIFNTTGLIRKAIFNTQAFTGFTTQSLPDTTSPVITVAPIVTPISARQSIITWTTDEIADSQVNYYVNGQTLKRVAGDITQGFSHSIVLTNLAPSAEYQFTVTSFDPSGNQVTSGVFSFTNNGTDQTAPVTPTSTQTPTRTSTGTAKPTRTKTPTPTVKVTQTPSAKTLIFQSNSAYDGWVLESSENGNTGGSMYSAEVFLNTGDDAAKKQYRSILSFNTAPLPDTAVITKLTLKVKKNGFAGGSTNLLTTFQGFMVDMKYGFFGNTPALEIADFQNIADQSYGPFNPSLTNNFYYIDLTNAKSYVNKLATKKGLTQLRLRFKLDDNNNAIANYLSLYSGNAAIAADRPQLVVTYYVP